MVFKVSRGNPLEQFFAVHPLTTRLSHRLHAETVPERHLRTSGSYRLLAQSPTRLQDRRLLRGVIVGVQLVRTA